MSIYFIILLIFIPVVFLYIIRVWLNKLEEKNTLSQELIEWLKTNNTSLDQKLSEQMRNFNDRLDKAAYIIAQVQKNIGEFSEIGRSLKDFQQFLSSPKIRGNIGEQILKDLLNQHFPKTSFKTQYKFKNGETVDAVIFTSQGLIPIDAKFPLDNFKKYLNTADEKEKLNYKKNFISDLKKHIEAIAKKYILPQENTVDYALMYIPSENIYYEIITNDELFDFAGKKMVLPVSPMSFYAYMKALLLSFEGQKIEEKAKQVISLLKAIKQDYLKLESNLNKLNTHLTNAYNQSNKVLTTFQSLGQKINTSFSIEDKEKKMLD